VPVNIRSQPVGLDDTDADVRVIMGQPSDDTSYKLVALTQYADMQRSLEPNVITETR